MNTLQHGKLSFGIIAATQAAAFFLGFLENATWTLAYSIAWIFSGWLILRNYCRYCMGCRDRRCMHRIPGRIAKFLFGFRYVSAYSLKNHLMTLVGVSGIMFLPAAILWRIHLYLFIGYWIVLGFITLEVFFYVCPGCCNSACFLRKLWEKQ